MAIDDASNANSIAISGKISDATGFVREIPRQYPHPAPYTRQSFSLGMPLNSYRPGIYAVELTIEDQVAGTSVTVTGDFAVLAGGQSLGSR
jgi:hypothetical protein